MVRLRLAVLLGILIAGCAAYWQAHTEGTSGPIAWYITDARSESNPVAERYTYAFVLVLQETQGTATNPGADERTVQGIWKLQRMGDFSFRLRILSLVKALKPSTHSEPCS